MIEYRICWSASSNIRFKGDSDWHEWEDEDATADEVEDSLTRGRQECMGLEEVISASGFEWYVETRVKETADA